VRAPIDNSIDHFRCSTFEKIEELSEKLLAKSTVARFVDKGKDSGVVARLIERLREAIVCYQVGGYCTPASNVVDRGADIAAASDVPSNNSPRSKAMFPIASGISTDRPLSQVIVRYALETSRGNPPQYDRNSTCSQLNRNPHQSRTS